MVPWQQFRVHIASGLFSYSYERLLSASSGGEPWALHNGHYGAVVSASAL